MNILVFEDKQVHNLFPITIGRAAFQISCGSYRLLDWLAMLGQPIRAMARRHLREILRLDAPVLAEGSIDPSQGWLLINARVVPSASVMAKLKELIGQGRAGVVQSGEWLAAAVLTPAVLQANSIRFDQVPDIEGLPALLDKITAAKLPAIDVELPLFHYPHEVVREHLKILGENLENRLKTGDYREVADGVFAADGATLGQYVVSNTAAGPIVLEAEASIGPYCYLSGPAHLGRKARVIEHSALKDAVALGHTTKIGGEVEASIIEPYTNKQHHGFLGHSYLGSWINLGAGTCNSDLKNTYGQVKMDYRHQSVATGMQFIGTIVGDYSKSAINTGIFTGKVVGTCSMLYGYVTTNVPSFTNYARLFGQVTELPVEVMVATQKRMFQRRSVEQRPCDIQLLHDMYELTRDERQIGGEPLSL